MAEIEKCPLCGENCTHEYHRDRLVRFHCKTYNTAFFIDEDLLEENDEKKEKSLDLIAELLIRKKKYSCGSREIEWSFFNDPVTEEFDEPQSYKVNIARILNSYPNNAMGIADRALLNLSILYPHYGDNISVDYAHRRILFEHESNNSGSSGVLMLLNDLGYLSKLEYSEQYRITAKGWEKINELISKEEEIKQGFIAMSFSQDANIIREVFHRAIHDAGFSDCILDEKEHNNQIVPEIFYEIRRSKFVVVDVTFPSYGAYYEAGFAQALGKQVIICCRKNEFKSEEKKLRPHFDIAQQAIIVWEDETDLYTRLVRRINATVLPV